MVDPYKEDPATGDGFYRGYGSTDGNGGYTRGNTELWITQLVNKGYGLGNATGGGYSGKPV